MFARLNRNRRDLISQSLTLAILVGLLLFPATCSHAAGPHSLFIDPRGESPEADEHAGHGASGHAHFSAADELATQSAHGDADDATGGPMLHDLPTTMLVSIATANLVIDLPQLLMIPAAGSPAALRLTDRLTGIAPPIEVPPPRAVAR